MHTALPHLGCLNRLIIYLFLQESPRQAASALFARTFPKSTGQWRRLFTALLSSCEWTASSWEMLYWSIEENFWLKSRIPGICRKKMKLPAADGDSKLQQREVRGPWAGLVCAAQTGRAERALAERGSWWAGMCRGSTAGFYLCAGQGWETGYGLSWEQEGRSAATPPFTLRELAPCWSHFSGTDTQFLEFGYHSSSASGNLFAFFLLPCL